MEISDEKNELKTHKKNVQPNSHIKKEAFCKIKHTQAVIKRERK